MYIIVFCACSRAEQVRAAGKAQDEVNRQQGGRRSARRQSTAGAAAAACRPVSTQPG